MIKNNSNSIERKNSNSNNRVEIEKNNNSNRRVEIEKKIITIVTVE